jgi:hypothetical protein
VTRACRPIGAWSCERRAQVTSFMDAVIDGPVQAIRQDVARESDPRAGVLEPARAIENLARDHPHPALADDSR